MTAIISKLLPIGIIVLSLTIGFLSYYLLSDVTKEQKKKQLEELTSQIINFVIFVWLGKILFNLSIFISDPLSILAYPSDSKSFYFAIVLISIVLFYKSKRNNLNVILLLESFTHTFLIGSFIYEFIQFVIEDNPFAFGYLILLAILIGLFFFLRERLSFTVLLIIIVTVWSVGMVAIGFVQPYVTVYGFMMAPWFVAVIFIMSMSGLVYKLRKGNS